MTEKKSLDGADKTKLIVAGASVAALAAGAYFFFGPNGKKNQKNAKAWALKMKAEIIEKLETAREVSEPVYNQIIDTVAAEYLGAKKADQGEISKLVKDLKKQWKTLTKPTK